MSSRHPGATRTFDIVRAAKKTEARIARKRFIPIVLGVLAVSAGMAVGGRLGSGIAAGGLLLLAKRVDRRAIARWLRRRADELPPSRSRARDEVDQASWASFPASDPPAFSGR
ncbi:MAG TPA: hypothetical protein VGK73_21405 [Polyangiaceae bacterium]